MIHFFELEFAFNRVDPCLIFLLKACFGTFGALAKGTRLQREWLVKNEQPSTSENLNRIKMQAIKRRKPGAKRGSLGDV